MPISGGLDINPRGSGLGQDHQSIAGSAGKPGTVHVALAPLAKLGSVFENKNSCDFTSHAMGVQQAKWKRVFP